MTNYWYSPTQKQTLAALAAIDGRRFHPMSVNGKEYTECHDAPQPLGRYSDYILVASTNDGPCGRNDGDWD